MNKISFSELESNMMKYNREHPDREDNCDIKGVIVYKASNWDKEYSLESRSYEVGNNNRCFQAGKLANSLFGYNLDGTDVGVRLDWYKWDVDYCYMK